MDGEDVEQCSTKKPPPSCSPSLFLPPLEPLREPLESRASNPFQKMVGVVPNPSPSRSDNHQVPPECFGQLPTAAAVV